MCAAEPSYYLVLDVVSHTTMRVRGRRSVGTFPDLEKGEREGVAGGGGGD